MTVIDTVVGELSPVSAINVSQSSKSQLSGSIAVDPTSPNRLFAAMPEFKVDTGIRIATSEDEGATWTPRLAAVPDDPDLPPARGNPDVLFDDFGNLFLAYSGAEDNIVVAWSIDGGHTFKKENHVNIRFTGGEGNSPGSPRLAFGTARNEVWITYETSSVRAAGATVSGLGQVGAFDELTVTGSAGGRHSDIEVGPNGEVSVVWQTRPANGEQARLMSSVDIDGLGESTFTLPNTVDVSATDGVLQTPGQVAAVPLGARLAWDRSDGPHRGRLYATYVDLVEGLPNPPGTPELTLFVTYSDDLGMNWSTPSRVTFSPNIQSMFQPAIAIDPTTGILAVGWYATASPEPTELSTSVGFFVATSADGKQFSSVQRVNIDASNVITPDPEMLDVEFYGGPGLAFQNGRLYPLWSDNSDLEGSNYSAPQFETATRVIGIIDVVVAPPAIQPLPIEVIIGQPFTLPVATFSIQDASANANQFTARIAWGDQVSGGSSDGTITQPGGPGTPFFITGTHTYTQLGAYPIAVTVTDSRTGVASKSVSNVSAKQGSQGQPTIAVDPTNPKRLFAAWSDRGGLERGIPVATSDDGGVTWKQRLIADGQDGLVLASQAGHAVFDQFGNLFFTYVTRSPVFNTVVLSSKDGGNLFTVLRRFETPKSVEPSIAVGPGEGGQGGSVWVTWSHGPAEDLTVTVAGAQVDGLDRFQSFNQRNIAPTVSDGVFRVYGDIAVGANGQVLVTYSKGVTGGAPEGPAEIMVQLDPDGFGSEPFGPPIRATKTNVGPRTEIPTQAINAIDARGRLAWDRSESSYQGRVYLIYTDSASIGATDTNILLRFSDDNGLTWSAPTDIDTTSKASFLPAIAVDQSSGNLAMVWYDSDGDASQGSTSASFIVTLSDDGGRTHRLRYVVSPGSSDATSASVTDEGKSFQFGRFAGIAFSNGIVQPIWTDNSLELAGVPDPRNFDIANARIGVATVTHEPLVVEMVEISEREGSVFTRKIAGFTDPSGTSSPSDFTAKIDWGDGQPLEEGEIQREADGSYSVLGTHEYEAFGRYPIRVSIKGSHTKGAGEVTAIIENAPIYLYFGDGSEEGVRVVRETTFTKAIATLIDENPYSDPEDFDVTINWGDGTITGGVLEFTFDGGTGESNTFSVTGSHRYLTENTYDVLITVREKSSSVQTGQTGPVVSGDPPLIVKPGDFLDIEALEGINTGDLVLAKFTLPDDIEVPLQSTLGSYTATINWGDGEVDVDVVPFVTSEDVTIVGRHTYATAGEFYPYITLEDDSGGFFYVPLIAIVEPDVTDQVSAPLPALTYNPISEKFVGELVITNTSDTDIAGPLFIVVRGLPDGVTLDSFTAVDGLGNPLYKVNQSKLPAGSSLPPVSLEFRNPNRVPIQYSIQVFDGLKPQPLDGAGVVFEPNRGQVNPATDFIARGQGYTIGLSAGQVSLVLSGTTTQAGTAAMVELVGANTSTTGVARDPLPGVSNYFVGSASITGVPHFGRVRYAQVYSGIDIEYYGRDGLLEYDWIVRPYADAKSIAVRFRGVDSMTLDTAGNLRLRSENGELVQLAPVAYQVFGGDSVPVSAAYDLRLDGTVGIALGSYDRSQPLVIDPVLVYSTYLGGSGFESANAIAVDAEGNTYVTGTTGSSDFFTANPFDSELNQPDTSPFALSVDAFITKFDANGDLVFSTYLGGGSSDLDPAIRETQGRSIAVDSEGQVWVAGITQSKLFPTTGPAPHGYEANLQTGGSFFTQLSADGTALLYSTVTSLSALDIAVDESGDVYAAGVGFALKLEPDTNAFKYVHLLGNATARGIAVDSIGQAYITGFTNSPDFPIKNALFPVLGTAETLLPQDREGTGFVVKLLADGNVDFSTYLGSTFEVEATDIAVDRTGLIYVVGQTSDDDLPVPGGIDTSRSGRTDGFLIRLANDGQELLYGTYIGGSGTDRVTGVGVDSLGRAYVSGTTNSADLATVRAHQQNFGGSLFLNDFPDDGFAASISKNGQSFEYLTYWGGQGVDSLRGVSVDAKGNASFAGTTSSPDLLVLNAVQPRLVGSPALVLRLLSGDAGTVSMQNAPFTAIEGETYNGVVAFFNSNGTETADQFSATIDWGDGISSAATITGNFNEGFQIRGTHLYLDVGSHDVFVTLRDSLGRLVTVTSSGTVDASEGRIRYRIGVDTTALSGTQGLLSFQWNSIPGSPEVQAIVRGLSILGGSAGTSTIDGSVNPLSSNAFSMRPLAPLNRFLNQVTLGTRIEFDLEFIGPGLAGQASSTFAIQLLNASGRAALLSSDSSASLLRVTLSRDGKTIATASNSAVTAAASGTATVTNGPIRLKLEPFTIQEGTIFAGTIAKFDNGNPIETAIDFKAEIDWGDGSPVTSGTISGNSRDFVISGNHVYQRAGSYALTLKLIDPDGMEFVARSGRSILAAETIKNNWRSSTVMPASGDFNGDGILDLAIGPYLAIPTGSGEGVAIFLGRGDGTFAQSDFKATGTSINQLAAADFNNDGRLDIALAITRFGESTVEVIFGNGDGTLQSSMPLADLRNPSNLLTADFNGDGFADLVYNQSDAPSQSVRSSSLRVALGRGDGTFLAPGLTPIPSGVQRIDVGNLNGDSIPDVLLATSDSTGATRLSIYRGVGEGNFAVPSTIASGLGLVASMLIHDVDGDGMSDIVVSVGQSLQIFEARGDGTFRASMQIAAPGGAVAAGDFDRDGRTDLALTDRGSGSNLGRITVFIQDDAQGFTSTSYEGVANPSAIFARDFDRDGLLDLATSGTLAAVSVLPGLGDGRFASSERIATGLVRVDPSGALRETPQGVVVADLNGDSHSDALLLFGDGPSVAQIGNGDGTFQPVVSTGSFAALNSGNVGLGFGSFRNPVLADFNNDGRLDLVGTSQQSGIGIVFGQGDGTFPTSHVEAPSGAARVSSDFNGDGRLDIATVGNNAVNIFLARVDGTFPSFQNSAQYPTGTGPRSIAKGDFNGDLKMDLAIANINGTVSILFGRSDGTFSSAINIVVGVFPFGGSNGIQPQSVQSGDYNQDGRLDLVVLGFAGGGVLLPGGGDGTFGSVRAFTTLGGADGGLNGGRYLASGDFNLDGKLDIVVASEGHANTFIQGGGLSVLLGNGDFTFQPAVTYADRSKPTALALGDFNKDGRIDIAMANINNGLAVRGQVSVLLGNPDGTFQSPANFSTVGANPRGMDVGDLNADGNPDLAVFNNSGDTAILLGTGLGTFRTAINYFTRGDGSQSGPMGVSIADYNNDGRADVASSSTFLYGLGDGVFPNRQLFTYLPPVINVDFRTSLPTEVAAGDLNADGNTDLAIAMAGTTIILWGHGNGSFSDPVLLSPPAALGIDPTSTRVSLADMDGDRDLDLVSLHARIGQAGGAVAIWRNTGQGSIGSPVVRFVPMPTFETSTVTGSDLELGDLNGDAFVDVVVTDSGVRGTDLNAAGGVSTLLGVGDGTLGTPVRYAMPPRQTAYGISLGDVNADGRPELVMLSSPLGFDFARAAVGVFANKGDGTFGPFRLLEFGGSSGMFLATGDFNSDGSADIIIPNSDANTFSIIFAGDGPATVTDAPLHLTALNLNPRPAFSFTTVIATFVDDNSFSTANEFTANIDWGDGQVSTGNVVVSPLGGYQVLGTHTYATIGTFSTTVTIRETGRGTYRASAVVRVNTSGQAITGTGLTIDAIEEIPFKGIVATFTDLDANGSVGDFNVMIDWGDGGSSSGHVSTNPDGGFNVYGRHTYGMAGTFPVSVTINDIGGNGGFASGSARVAVRINRRPDAQNDGYEGQEDSILNVAASLGLVANDSDPDGDHLIPIVVETTSHGVLTVLDDGGFKYAPAPNFSGTDRFTYRAFDGVDVGDLTTVTIQILSVNDVPVAVNDLVALDEDTDVFLNVLANDLDIDGRLDTSSVTIVAQPIYGSVRVDNVTGEVNYAPAPNTFGYDSFRYQVKDEAGLTGNIATVSVFVRQLNDSPLALDDRYWVNEDTVRFVDSIRGVLENDSDRDGDTLVTVLDTAASHGTVTLQSNGSFIYIPNRNYSGSDQFVYRASDRFLSSSPVTVALTVVGANDAPVVSPMDDVISPEGSAVVAAGAFSDVDDNDTWIALVDYGDGTGEHSLALDGNRFTLNHNYQDSGLYQATVRVIDGAGAVGRAAFTVQVDNAAAEVNAGPGQSVSEGAIVRVAASFVDRGTNDAHSAVIDWGDGSTPTEVPITESGGSGSLLLSHRFSDNGTFTVTLMVTDDEGAMGSDSLIIVVGNVPPAIAPISDLLVSEGQTFLIQTELTDPGSGDSHFGTVDWGDGSAIQPVVIRRDLNGWVVSTNHRYLEDGTYDATLNIRDDEGAIAFESFTILVQNEVPIVDAGPDRAVDLGQWVELPVVDFINLSNNEFGLSRTLRQSGSFVDPGPFDSHSASIDWGDGTTELVLVTSRISGAIDNPSGLSGFVQAKHRYSRPGDYLVTLRLTDSDGGVGTDGFAVTVLNAGNNPPVANDDEVSTDEDTPLSINVLANDSFAPDIDEQLTIISVTQSAHGTVIINLNGTVTYVPSSNYFGIDRFVYTIDDRRGGTADATVTVLVKAVNDAAVIEGTSTGSIVEDEAVTLISGMLTVIDPDSGENVFQAPASLQGVYGMFSFDTSSGNWTYTLDNSRPATDALMTGQIASDTLVVRSVDGTASRAITVAIQGVDSITDVTSLVSFRYYGSQFNARTKTYTFYGTITNKSSQPIRGPIELGWSNIIPTTARAKGNTGTWSDGSPYFDLSSFVGTDGVLLPGETSKPRTFSVTVASSGAFSFVTRVTGVVASVGASGEDGHQASESGWSTSDGWLADPGEESEVLYLARHNIDTSVDVNGDGWVSPLDALLIVDTLITKGSRYVARENAAAPYVDTSADNHVTPLDILLVIDVLRHNRTSGEGEQIAANGRLGGGAGMPGTSEQAAFGLSDLVNHTEKTSGSRLSGRKELDSTDFALENWHYAKLGEWRSPKIQEFSTDEMIAEVNSEWDWLGEDLEHLAFDVASDAASHKSKWLHRKGLR